MLQYLFRSNTGTDPKLFVNNQWGLHYYFKANGVAVLVTRSVMFITSEVMAKDLTIDIELPGHPAFYLKAVSADGDKTYLIAKDANLSLTIPENFQLQGMCPLEE